MAKNIWILTENMALRKKLAEMDFNKFEVKILNLSGGSNDVLDRSGDLILFDISNSDKSIWSDSTWKNICHKNEVLMLSNEPSDDEGRAVLEVGAMGYAHTHTQIKDLKVILESIISGSIWIGRSLLQRLLSVVNGHFVNSDNIFLQNSLSNREYEVAKLVAVGKSNSEISIILGITERTVRAHVSSVFDKLKITDRLMLALKFHGIK